MQAEVRDIVRPLTESIVLPLVGTGFILRGAASAVLKVAGPELQDFVSEIVEANEQPLDPGYVLAAPPFKMARRGVKRIYFVVTMKYAGGISTYDIVNKGFRTALDRAVKDSIKSLAVPALGCGDGRLDYGSVARLMVPIARQYGDRLDIKFVDKNKEFIDELGNLLGNER